MKRLVILLLLVSFCFAELSVGTTVSKSVADVKLISKTEYCPPNGCEIIFEYCLKAPVSTTDKYTWDYLNMDKSKPEILNSNLYLLEWQNVSKTRYTSKEVACKGEALLNGSTCYETVPETYYVMEQVEIPFTTFTGCKNVTWRGVNLPLGTHDVIPIIDGTRFDEFATVTVIYPYWYDGTLNTSRIWIDVNTPGFYVYGNGTVDNSNGSAVMDWFVNATNCEQNWTNSTSVKNTNNLTAGYCDVDIGGGARGDNDFGEYYFGNLNLSNSSYEFIIKLNISALSGNYLGSLEFVDGASGASCTGANAPTMLRVPQLSQNYATVRVTGGSNTNIGTVSTSDMHYFIIRINQTTLSATHYDENYTFVDDENNSVYESTATLSRVCFHDSSAANSYPVHQHIEHFAYIEKPLNFSEPSITYNTTETGNWIINGINYLTKTYVNVSDASYVFALDYSQFNSTNILISNESVSGNAIITVTIPTTIYPGGAIYCGATVNSTVTNITIQYRWYENSVLQNVSDCYQETATTGSQCGGVVGGEYGYISGWTGTHPATYAYDANWATYADASAAQPEIYINYTKPNGAIGAEWQIKDGGGTTNLTITQPCWDFDSDYISLKIQSDGIVNRAEWYCENSTTYTQLRVDATNEYIYEEAIYWIFDNDTVNTTNNTLTYSSLSSYFDFELDVGDNITCEARAYNGTNWTDWSNSSAVTVSSETINVSGSIYNDTRLIGDTMTFYANITNSSGVSGNLSEVEAHFYDYYWEDDTWGVYEHLGLSDLSMTEWYTNYYYVQTVPTNDGSNHTVKMYNISYFAWLNWTLPDGNTEIFLSNVTDAYYYNYFFCNGSTYDGDYCGNCTDTTCMAHAVNISLYDEEDTSLAVTGETDANFNASRGTSNKVFLFEIDNSSTFSYYIWPTWALLDVTSFEEYTATDYEVRFHFFNSAEITDTTTNVTVYMLNDSLSAYPTTIFVKDTYNNPVPWVYIVALRYYPETDSYVSVAMTKANEDGEATANLKYTDTWYKFAVYNSEGTQLYVSPSPVTIIVDPYPHITINIGTGNISDFDLYEGISFTCTGNWSSTVVTCDYIITSGAWKHVKLIVRESGRWTPICELQSNASAGSLGCNITDNGGSITDKFYRWEFIGHDPPPDFDIMLAEGSLDYFGGQQYGVIGVFIGFLIFAAVVLGFSVIHPVAGMFAGVITLVVIYLLNLVYMDIAMLTGLGVLAIIAGWLLRR